VAAGLTYAGVGIVVVRNQPRSCSAGGRRRVSGASSSSGSRPARPVAAFAARLKEALDPDSDRADLAGAVLRSLEPAHVSVMNVPHEHHSLGSERGLATPSPDGKGREISRPPH
jgi:hypothetical protein